MTKKELSNDPFIHLLDIILARKVIILIGFFSVFAIALVGVFSLPPTYVASTKLYINQPSVPRLDVPFVSDLSSAAFINNQVSLISSRVISEQVVKKLNLQDTREPSKFRKTLSNILKRDKADPLESAISSLANNTWTSFKKKTNIVEIHAQSSSSTGAANIANAVAETYITYANTFLFKKSSGAYSFIEERVEVARRQVEISEQAMEAYKEREKLTSIKDTIAPMVNKLTDYEAQLEQVKAQIAALENVSSGETNKTLEDTPTGSNQFPLKESSEVQEMRARLNNTKIKLETALNLYTEDHPEVRSLRSKISKLQENLFQMERYTVTDLSEKKSTNETLLYINNLTREKAYLTQQIQRLNNKLHTLSKKEYEWAKLNRDLKNKEARYTLLLGKLETAGILKTNEMQQAGITIIDYASPPPYPLKKKQLMLTALGFVIGLLFGLSMAFIVEYYDDSFKDVGDIEDSLQLPILASFPNANKKM